MEHLKTVPVVIASREQFMHLLIDSIERDCEEEAERLRKREVAKRYAVNQSQ